MGIYNSMETKKLLSRKIGYLTILKKADLNVHRHLFFRADISLTVTLEKYLPNNYEESTKKG